MIIRKIHRKFKLNAFRFAAELFFFRSEKFVIEETNASLNLKRKYKSNSLTKHTAI